MTGCAAVPAAPSRCSTRNSPPTSGPKIDAIERVSPDIVASANPGCSLHLAAGGVEVVHPMQLIDQALRQRT